MLAHSNAQTTRVGDLAQAAEKLDYATIALIRDEGLNRSQVMDHISWLSDVYGPRLTGGPGIMQASDWAIRKFTEWGLANAHRETLRVRQGLVARALLRAPDRAAGAAAHRLPRLVDARHERARSRPTSSACRSTATPTSRSYRGKLAGKIVLTQPAREVRDARRPRRAPHGREGVRRGGDDADSETARRRRRGRGARRADPTTTTPAAGRGGRRRRAGARRADRASSTKPKG